MAKRKQQQLVRITWPSLDRELPEARKIRLDAPPSPYSQDQNQILNTVLGMLMTVIGPLILVMTMMLRGDQGSPLAKYLMIFGSIITTALTITMATVSLRSQRKQVEKQKEEVNKKFAFYRTRLSNWKRELEEAYQNQKSVLENWHPSLRDLFAQLNRIIANKSDDALSTNLWWIGRESNHFLTLTLGKGPVALLVQPELESRDNQDGDVELLQQVYNLEEHYSSGEQFPYVITLSDVTFLAGCGSRLEYRLAWLRSVMTRLTLTHRYDGLRVLVLSSGSFEQTEVPDEEVDSGDVIPWYYHIPHVMGNLGIYSKDRLEAFLEENEEIFRVPVKDRGYHVLIVIDDWAEFEEEPIAKRLLQAGPEQGIITLLQVSALSDVPQGNVVTTIELNTNATQATLYRNGLKITQLEGLREEWEQTLHVRDPESGLQQIAVYMSNIYFPNAPQSSLKQAVIPESILFDDLFTDRTEGLDEASSKRPMLRSKEIKNIWDARDIAFSQTNHIYSIAGRGWEGRNQHIDLFKRNHGFVGGTTGSGKSVFLQAYLLSLAVSYSPENIGFVLIDGKGGGMAEPLKHLPHVRGTADSGELFTVQRALTAIEAEFRKRDEAFKETGQFEWKDYMKGYYQEKQASLISSSVKVRPNLPLLLIVFDELGQLIKFSAKKYSDIVENLLSTLERLAGQGRSYGIRLLFSGHSPSEAQRVAHNLDYMIALKVEDRDSSKGMIGDERAIRIRSKGRGFVRMGEEVFEFQGAYAKPERVVAITKELQFLSRDIPLSPIVLDPLPEAINIEELGGYEEEDTLDLKSNFIIPLGLLDLPEQQKQVSWAYNLAEEGNIAFTGPMKSGKTMALHSIIMSAVHQYDPGELSIWLVDWDGYSLKKWVGCPQVIEYLDDRNDGLIRFKHLINYLYNKMEERKGFSAGFDGRGWNEFKERATGLYGRDLSYHVLAIDGYVRVSEYLEQKSLDDNQRFMSILSDGARYGIYIVSTINNTAVASRSRGKRGFNTIMPLASSELCYDFYGREGLRMTEEVPGRAVHRLDWKMGRTIKKICCELQLVMPILYSSGREDQRLEDAVAESIEELKQKLEYLKANSIVKQEWSNARQQEQQSEDRRQVPQAEQQTLISTGALEVSVTKSAAVQVFLERQNIKTELNGVPFQEPIELDVWVEKREAERYPVLLYRSLQETTREAQLGILCRILNRHVQGDQTVDGIIPLIDERSQQELAETLTASLEQGVQEIMVWGSMDEQLADLKECADSTDKQFLFVTFGTMLWKEHPEEAKILRQFHTERKDPDNNELASLHEWLGVGSIMPNGAHRDAWQDFEGDLLLLSLNAITEYLYFLAEKGLINEAAAIAEGFLVLQNAQTEEQVWEGGLVVRQQFGNSGMSLGGYDWISGL
jgi:DNA segregation ATPase FtsK/SpoIIIE, S-DNA-T family